MLDRQPAPSRGGAVPVPPNVPELHDVSRRRRHRGRRKDPVSRSTAGRPASLVPQHIRSEGVGGASEETPLHPSNFETRDRNGHQ